MMLLCRLRYCCCIHHQMRTESDCSSRKHLTGKGLTEGFGQMADEALVRDFRFCKGSISMW